MCAWSLPSGKRDPRASLRQQVNGSWATALAFQCRGNGGRPSKPSEPGSVPDEESSSCLNAHPRAAAMPHARARQPRSPRSCLAAVFAIAAPRRFARGSCRWRAPPMARGWPENGQANPVEMSEASTTPRRRDTKPPIRRNPYETGAAAAAVTDAAAAPNASAAATWSLIETHDPVWFSGSLAKRYRTPRHPEGSPPVHAATEAITGELASSASAVAPSRRSPRLASSARRPQECRGPLAALAVTCTATVTSLFNGNVCAHGMADVPGPLNALSRSHVDRPSTTPKHTGGGPL
mmetsp:Transcript_75039/g.208636  ORF Transcript_75039/g.208636 Transcript_75039/m.208636 type:complete len:293 (-) Transcript_75039:8-886(-)